MRKTRTEKWRWPPGTRKRAAGVVAVTVGGFAGALVDSLLGATVQVQYRCPGCGQLTERRAHCDGQVTVRASGVPWIGNDAVNALATFAGAATAGLLQTLW